MKKLKSIDVTTAKGRDQFYQTPEWRAMRRVVLTDHPWCVVCLLTKKQHNLATEVDHVVDIKLAPGRCFDKTNLQSLCKSCHSAKTFEENKDKSSFGKSTKMEVVNKKWIL